MSRDRSATAQEWNTIPINDVWVAAIASVRGATVVTNDAHFGKLRGSTSRTGSVRVLG